MKNTRGSEWNKWDLHIHTASSYDSPYKADDADELLCRALIENDIKAVAITDHFKIDKGSIARSIQKLQEKQFINKEIDENNRRKYQLSLTEKGRAVALKIMDLNNEWENQIYSTCNTDEKQIVELMRKITISSINIQKNTQKEEKNG